MVLLSGGNQQKVVLGKWLAADVDLLVMDEPTRGIDVAAKVEIYEEMNRLTARGAGILMISSELPEVLGMSDRILVMRQGRIVAEMDAAGATQEKVLRRRAGAGLVKLAAWLASKGRQVGTLAGLVLLCLLLTFLSPYFLTVSNLLNVLEQTAINAVIAVGMTFVIVSGGIDLSVGSMVAFSGVLLASALQAGLPIPVAIAVGLVAGAALRPRERPPRHPRATASVHRHPRDDERRPGRRPRLHRRAGPCPASRRTSGPSPRPRAGDPRSRGCSPRAVYALAHLLLTRTRFGRYVYAIGGNEEATRLSGVAVRFHKTMVYVLSGVMSALAAVLLTARLNSAQPIAGIMYELDAIAATVIGGTSLLGGSGSLGGTLIGALIMGVLRNGLNLLGISSFLQQIVIGVVIIVAVLVDSMLKRPGR